MKIIKSYKIIIIVIILIVAIASGVYFYNRYTYEKNYFDFYDERDNVSVSVPRTWHEIKGIDRAKHSVLADFAFQKNERDKSVVTFAIVYVPGKNNLQIQDSMKSFDENYPKQLKEFKKIDGREIKIQEVKGLQYDFNYLSSGLNETGVPIKGEPITQRKIIFLKDERIFYVDLAALTENFPEELIEFEKMLESFKILEPIPEPPSQEELLKLPKANITEQVK